MKNSLVVFGVGVTLWIHLIAAQLSCDTTSQLDESSIRSSDRNSAMFLIVGGFLASPAPANPEQLVTVSSTSSLIQVEEVIFATEGTPEHRIILRLKQLTSYDLYENDTLSFDFPSSFFQLSVPCSSNLFNVTPTAGELDDTTTPQTLSEADINEMDTTFLIGVAFEEFVNATPTIMNVLPSGLRLQFSLEGLSPSRQLRVTIPQNTTFNILSNETIEVQLSFPGSMTRSGIPPVVVEGLDRKNVLKFGIAGMKAFVRVEYDDPFAGGIKAMEMWDGTGSVTLKLVGDEWEQDPSLWHHEEYEPIFNMIRPIQVFGFSYFFNRGYRPSINVTARNVVMKFPPMYGYTLSSTQVEQIEVTRLNGLVREKIAPNPFSIRVLQTPANKIQIRWFGGPFQATIRESKVRKQGLSFTVRLKYDVFSSSASLINVKRMFSGSEALSLSFLQFRVNLTDLHVVIPAQISYNIDRNDIINLTMQKALLSTGSELSRPKTGFVIQPMHAEPECSVFPAALDEDMVRNIPNLTFTVYIREAADDFCYTEAQLDDLKKSIQVGGSSALQFSIQSYNSTAVTIGVQQNPLYDLTVNDYITLAIPEKIMCSLEMCRPVPAAPQGFSSNTILIPIVRTRGRLFATFPSVTEADMQTKSLTVELFVSGDSFKSDAQTASQFRPAFYSTGGDPERGFLGSIRFTCGATVDLANRSRAILQCQNNESYEIYRDETVTMAIDADVMAGDLVPTTDGVIPLRVRNLRGWAGSTIGRNVTIFEEEIINGGYTLVIQLYHERFNRSTMGPSMRLSVDVVVAPGRYEINGMQPNIATIFPDSSFVLDKFEWELTLTFAPAPNFNVQNPEEFSISVTPEATLSSLGVENSTFTFVVMPSPGRVTTSGTAVVTGISNILSQELYIRVTLHNDKWVKGASFDSDKLCPLSECTVSVVDVGLRHLDIRFEPNTEFHVYRNTTYSLPINETYVASGIAPLGAVTIFVYVTSGLFDWIQVPSTISEDQVREGKVPQIVVKVNGDKFNTIELVKSSLASSVTCAGSNDAFGFCSRANVLFGGVDFRIISNDRVLLITLQPDTEYDIYENEQVSLRFSAAGLVSRVTPNATQVYTFTVTPSRGQYFVSGDMNDISSRDITGDSGRQLKIILTLYGERWKSNLTQTIAGLLPYVVSDGLFVVDKAKVILPSSATLSPNMRILTLVLVPNPKYLSFSSETVTLSIPVDAVLSPYAPTLGSKTNSFVIEPAGGLITSQPKTTSAAILRTRGLNFSLVVEGDQWDHDQTSNGTRVANALRSSSAPLAEPSGFSVMRDIILAAIVQFGGNINGTELKLTMLPAPKYDLILPETISLNLGEGTWTTSKRQIYPVVFELLVEPEFRIVEAVLVNNNTYNKAIWTAAVAKALSVPTVFIEVISVDVEAMLPGLPQYSRLRFRVKSDSGIVPYDNNAATLFVSLNPKLQLQQFNVVTAFFGNEPPEDTFWKSLYPDTNVHDDTVQRSSLGWWYLLIFAGVLVLVVSGVAVYFHRMSGSLDSGVKRATAKSRRGEKSQRDEENSELEKLDLFVGQTKKLPDLKEDPEGILTVPLLKRPSTANNLAEAASSPSQTKFKQPMLSTMKIVKQQLPELRDSEVPLDLYSGQQSAEAQEAQQLERNRRAPFKVVDDLEEFSNSALPKNDYGVHPHRAVYGPYRSVLYKPPSHFAAAYDEYL